jgi:WG containing repeat
MKILLPLLLLIVSSNILCQNKQWICLNEDGSEAFQIEAKYVYKFSDGMAPVKISKVVDNRWVSSIGFVDKSGQLVIPSIYEKIKGKGFVNNRAWVKKKGDKFWTLIDKTGKRIPTANYDKVAYIHEVNGEMLCVYQGDYLGFINQAGKEVIPCNYFGGTTFQQGLACVSKGEGNEGYGFMDKTGKMIIPLQFKQAGITNFMANGMSRAGVNGKTVLIDKSGKIVFKTSKGNIQGVSNGWVRMFTKNDRTGWGYLSFKEKWMIQPIYDDLEKIRSDGRVAAQKNKLWGIIDTLENIILDFKYGSLFYEPEEDGYVMGAYPVDEPTSLMNTPKDYFTPALKPVDLTGIKYIYSADSGPLMPFQASNDKRGYLNRNFEIVVPAKYKKAASFKDGRAWVRME